MKLKEDLVKRLRDGEVTVEYDGESLDKLREVLGSVNTVGMFEYYSFDINGVYYFHSEKEDIKGKIIPLADFFESDMEELKGYYAHTPDGEKIYYDSLKGLNLRLFDYVEDLKGNIVNSKGCFTEYIEEVVQFNPYKPKTAEERDQLVKELQAMTFEPTLDEAVRVLGHYNCSSDKELNQAIDVVVKHLKG